MAESLFYNDNRLPLNYKDVGSVTLATTSKMLFPALVWCPTGPGYWYVGKAVEIKLWGTITTAATPGNLTVDIRYGTTDAGGTQLATSAAIAATAGQTNISFLIKAEIECRDVGTATAGGLWAMGRAEFGTAVVASPGTFFIPASAPAVVGVDTTSSSGLHIGLARSGNTVETAQVRRVRVTALS